jgi:hypothetical protein
MRGMWIIIAASIRNARKSPDAISEKEDRVLKIHANKKKRGIAKVAYASKHRKKPANIDHI